MKKKVALVLSGGGARGIAHVGVIEELLKREYEITSIAGTSMGAVVGGFYAMDALNQFKEFLLTLDKRKTLHLLDFTFGSQGLVKGERLINTLKEFAADKCIEDLKLPYAAVAADILNKKEVVFTTGSIYDAIRASISIPSVFTPVKTKNQILVDGGILNNMPMEYVKRNSGDIMIAVNVNANVSVIKNAIAHHEVAEKQSKYVKKLVRFNEQVKKIKPKGFTEHMGYIGLIENTIGLMMYQITSMHLEKHTPDMLINISRDTCTTFDFFKAEELIEIGRLSTMRVLDGFI